MALKEATAKFRPTIRRAYFIRLDTKQMGTVATAMNSYFAKVFGAKKEFGIGNSHPGFSILIVVSVKEEGKEVGSNKCKGRWISLSCLWRTNKMTEVYSAQTGLYGKVDTE